MTDPITARADLFTAMQAVSKAETLPLFRQPMAIDNKQAASGGFDPVTEADRACETALRALIAEHFPDDGILGEEHGAHGLDAPFVWVIDPIDGTRAFVAGMPLWGTLVGLMKDGKPVAGLAYQPYIDEAFSAFSGMAWHTKGGARQQLRTRRCDTLETATLMTTTPALFDPQERPAYDALETVARSVRYGTDWYAYALIASGTCDLVIESGLSAYDILPLVPIIEAAGGTVTDWRGDPLTLTDGAFRGQTLATGDHALLAPSLDRLRPAAR